MRESKYWKYSVLAAAVMAVGCVPLARRDILLRRFCKDAVYESFFGQDGLYLLILLTAAFAGFVLWLFLSENAPAPRDALRITAAAVCLYAVLAGGYLHYHQSVYNSSGEQAAYQQAFDKGMLYALKKLTK